MWRGTLQEQESNWDRDNHLGIMKRSNQNPIMEILVEDEAIDEANAETLDEGDIFMVEDEMRSIAKESTYSASAPGDSQV